VYCWEDVVRQHYLAYTLLPGENVLATAHGVNSTGGSNAWTADGTGEVQVGEDRSRSTLWYVRVERSNDLPMVEYSILVIQDDSGCTNTFYYRS
jgi:hypothetical protein